MVVVLIVALVASSMVFANAQKEYPSQNINVIVQYSAGGGTDLSVRGVLDAAKGSLPAGVNFAVSNVTGGAGLIGLNQVVTSPSDGYTLGVLNTDLVINYALGRTKISVADFEPIACALIDPFVLIVDAKAPYKSFKEFIEYAKAHPGEIIVGETGMGAAPSLAVLAIEQFFGVDFKTVSYGGSADCVTAIVGGHIQATIAQTVNAAAQVQAGNLRYVASMSAERLSTYPNVPTMKESYPEMNIFMPGFCIISVKADVDASKVEYLRSVIRPAIDSAAFQNTLKTMGMQTINMDGAQTKAFLADQLKLYTELCKNIVVK
jgi:tripartite-type tricarboxylate transporter receptor subunit TctC